MIDENECILFKCSFFAPVNEFLRELLRYLIIYPPCYGVNVTIFGSLFEILGVGGQNLSV